MWSPAPGEVKLKVGRSPGTWAWFGDLPGLARSGEESHFLELEYDACGWHGDYGYSGWVQFEDGEIFCVYHHRDAGAKVLYSRLLVPRGRVRKIGDQKKWTNVSI